MVSLILTVTGRCVCVRVCVWGRLVVDRRQTLGADACVCARAHASFVSGPGQKTNREEKKAQDKFRCCLVNRVIKMSHTNTHREVHLNYSAALTDVCNSISCNKSALHPPPTTPTPPPPPPPQQNSHMIIYVQQARSQPQYTLWVVLTNNDEELPCVCTLTHDPS